MTQYKIDPKNPWKDPRRCMALPAGCPKPICQEIPRHPRCVPAEIKKHYQPMLDERNAELAKVNAQLAAERAPCNSVESQIASTKSALADCTAAKAACERAAGGKSHGKKRHSPKPKKKQHSSSKKNSNKGGMAAETPAQLRKRLADEVNALQSQIEAAKAQLATGAKCSVNLSALNSELAAVRAALADCDAKKQTACAPKPIDNGAFNLNTRPDMNHVRTGAGRKVYGTYQRGPKKGKLKKGYKFVNGVATKV